MGKPATLANEVARGGGCLHARGIHQATHGKITRIGDTFLLGAFLAQVDLVHLVV
jgi:hypothetical protein